MGTCWGIGGRVWKLRTGGSSGAMKKIGNYLCLINRDLAGWIFNDGSCTICQAPGAVRSANVEDIMAIPYNRTRPTVKSRRKEWQYCWEGTPCRPRPWAEAVGSTYLHRLIPPGHGGGRKPLHRLCGRYGRVKENVQTGGTEIRPENQR